jgi:ABC-type transport system involved in cytochrome c biogenesis permease component
VVLLLCGRLRREVLLLLLCMPLLLPLILMSPHVVEGGGDDVRLAGQLCEPASGARMCMCKIVHVCMNSSATSTSTSFLYSRQLLEKRLLTRLNISTRQDALGVAL